jgi:hypothetical protein
MTRQRTEVAPHRVDNEKLSVLQVLHFYLAILRLRRESAYHIVQKEHEGATNGEIQVGLPRHDERARLDLAEALGEVPAVAHGRDVAVLPGVKERNHVVRVPD